MSRWVVGFVFSAAAATASAQAPDPSVLTLERIFASGEFNPPGFSGTWTKDGAAYTTLAPAMEGGRGRDVVRIDAETGASTVLVPAALLVPPRTTTPLNVEGYEFSEDGSKILIFTESRRVWRVNSRGDYWVLDRSSRQLTKLGGDAPPSSLRHAKFSPDGRHVGYVRDNEVYVEDPDNPGPRRLTTAAHPEVVNGTFDWVYEEEFGLRDGFRFSPDGKFVAYWSLDTRGVPEFPLIDNTSALYPKITRIKYPKVGQTNSAATIEVVPVAGGAPRRLALPGDPRENYPAYLEWRTGAGRELVVQRLNRRQNELTVLGAEVEDGPGPGSGGRPSEIPCGVLFTETDKAWLDLQPDLRRLKDGRFVFLSERDGWRRIHLVAGGTGPSTPITAAGFDVVEIVAVDEPGGWIYYDASPDDATRRSLHRCRIDGSTPKGERITPADQPGTHHYEIAPTGRHAIHRRSGFDLPPSVDLVRLPSHERIRILADGAAVKARLDALKGRPVEFLKVPIDGATLDAWRLLPPDFDPAKKYPLIVHVYGEPAGQTVLDAWGGGNGLWHRMMAQKGYVVMSFDNRGTPAAKGREWRKAAHHKIGVLAPREQAAALRRTLASFPGIDPARVGVWGWSGGGSSTLHALFKFPDLYSVGVSIAPVSNQRYYDTIYQERYMGLPGDDVEAFREGSPINFASGLKGKLLLIHGAGDDNCHYQATEALIDELVRLNKPFAMMAYPNRSHAINEGVNTTLHLRSLVTRHFVENLPSGGRPR